MQSPCVALSVQGLVFRVQGFGFSWAKHVQRPCLALLLMPVHASPDFARHGVYLFEAAEGGQAGL